MHASDDSFMEIDLANFSLNTVLQGQPSCQAAMVFQCARMNYAVVKAELPCIASFPHF